MRRWLLRWRVCRPALAWVVAVATWLWGADAPAQVEPRRWSWTRGPGAESCSDADVVRAGVVSRLGYDPFHPSAGKSIHARIVREGAQWVARVEARDRDGSSQGTRMLTSDAPTCAPIENATTLAVALTIDPDAILRPLRPSAPPAPPPIRLEPCPAPRCPPPAHPPPRPAQRLHSAQLRAGWTTGLLPHTAFGLGWLVDMATGARTGAVATAIWMPEVRTESREFAFGLTALGMGGCADALEFPGGSVRGCVLAHAGALHAVVFQSPTLRPTEPGNRPWAALSAMPRLRITALGPVAFEAGVEAIVPLVRQPFTVTRRTEPVFRQSAVGAHVFVAGGATF